MKIKATVKPIYVVEKDGKTIGEFEEVSEWEGMVKLKSKDGVIIACKDDSAGVFQFLFNGYSAPKGDQELSVVKATAGLFPMET